ncbi:hypothetical protein M0811_09408 [Anaeramoeba ignava]|uniref:Transmembrane protein n=1 Tax=Anaeramoeba ignava TaxID=1746090 RepID=A0A9Q0LG86_ANAIG|nr:hypothetical protein M0811_09408 [Anaeramoeba ignava]
MTSASLGYLASFIAAIFFGSYLAPVNKVQNKLGDGMIFQFILSNGIFLIGLLTVFIPEHPIFVKSGIIGGIFIGFANMFVSIGLEFVGLGVGFLFSSGTNLIVGYLVGRLGLFGATKEKVKSEAYSILGVLLALFALILFYFIKPSLDKTKKRKSMEKEIQWEEINFEENQNKNQNQNHNLNQNQNQNQNQNKNQNQNQNHNKNQETETEWQDIYTEKEEKEEKEEKIKLKQNYQETDFNFDFDFDFENKFVNYLKERNDPKLLKKIRKMGTKSRHFIGVMSVVIIGIFTGVNLIPMMIWSRNNPNSGQFDFVLSHFTGIFIASLVGVVTYSIFVKPLFSMDVLFPSFISGLIWGTASVAWFISTRTLGFSVGYPIVCIGPIVVSSLWSIFYFKEIHGKRNFLIFFGTFFLFSIAVTFLVLSKK